MYAFVASILAALISLLICNWNYLASTFDKHISFQAGERSLLNIQPFLNNPCEPIFHVFFPVNTRKENRPLGKSSRKGYGGRFVLVNLYSLIPFILVICLSNDNGINFFFRLLITSRFHISHPVK